MLKRKKFALILSLGIVGFKKYVLNFLKPLMCINQEYFTKIKRECFIKKVNVTLEFLSIYKLHSVCK